MYFGFSLFFNLAGLISPLHSDFFLDYAFTSICQYVIVYRDQLFMYTREFKTVRIRVIYLPYHLRPPSYSPYYPSVSDCSMASSLRV